jgi:hypothetical protein
VKSERRTVAGRDGVHTDAPVGPLSSECPCEIADRSLRRIVECLSQHSVLKKLRTAKAHLSQRLITRRLIDDLRAHRGGDDNRPLPVMFRPKPAAWVHVNVANKEEKGNPLRSCTAGVEDAIDVHTKDPVEIVLGQLQCGFDDRDASVLNRESAGDNRPRSLKTDRNDTGDVALELTFDPLKSLLQLVEIAHVALVSL